MDWTAVIAPHAWIAVVVEVVLASLAFRPASCEGASAGRAFEVATERKGLIQGARLVLVPVSS